MTTNMRYRYRVLQPAPLCDFAPRAGAEFSRCEVAREIGTGFLAAGTILQKCDTGATYMVYAGELRECERTWNGWALCEDGERWRVKGASHAVKITLVEVRA